MRIHAILSWYEEPASWLAATVASLQGVADHIVAVDGAYFLTPGAIERPTSGREQSDAITAVAHSLGIGLTMVIPDGAWLGNEVEKRSAAFRVANALATPGEDWFLIMDADEVVTAVPFDLRDQLAGVVEDVATCTSWVRYTDHPDPDPAMLAAGDQGIVCDPIIGADPMFRKLFRADPTLRVVGSHYVYQVGPDESPRFLWGHPGLHQMEDAASLPGLKVEHRSKHRAHGRRTMQLGYYRNREQSSAEFIEKIRVAA